MNCSLKNEENVNYNTKLLTFMLPGASRMIVPVGHHISIKAKDKQGSYICVPYVRMYIFIYMHIIHIAIIYYIQLHRSHGYKNK